MTPIKMLVRSVVLVLAAWGGAGADEAPVPDAVVCEVCVYGATPAGLAAAVGAARDGRSVTLIEPTARVGGLVTSGLSHTDFHSLESLTGAFREFADRVESHYVTTYGHDSDQHRACFHGTFGEPHVNLTVFEALLAEHPSITVLHRTHLAGVRLDESKTRILSIEIEPTEGYPPRPIDRERASTPKQTVTATIFIDATYEGDLMAGAGVPYHVGREAKSQYGESLAPEAEDGQLQAYNFRFIMTNDPDNRVTPSAPPGYRRDDFLDVVPILKSGQIKQVFGYPSGCIFKAQTPALPHHKYDINDVSRGVIRLSLPGQNLGWPDGDGEARATIFAEHRRDQEGLLYFLQNDEAVPAAFRDEARQWGWCRDEFVESGHRPPQLYVREARRMIGQHVYTQKDSEHAPDDARAVHHADAIASGDYGNNCHGTAHEGPRFGGRHTGEFYNPVPPYQIPYGVLVPRDVKNLLVCGAVSSSHVGFCALRLEPIWMSLGQAAGHAASQAVQADVAVQKVDVPTLQTRLHEVGSATIYVSDVPPSSPDFALAQWWGTRGGWHGLAPMPNKPGQRGKNLHGQYFEANPDHEAKLDAVLDEATFRRWQEVWTATKDIHAEAVPDLPKPDGQTTRRNYLNRVKQIVSP